MATIQIVLQAINDASRTFNDVADSLDTVAEAEIRAAEGARALSEAELAAAQSAVDAVAAYSELRASVLDVAQASAEAGAAAEQLATVTQRSAESAITAATAYARLSDAQLQAANDAVAAQAGFRAEDAALLDVTRDAVLATGGIRAMTAAELDAASAAMKTAFAVKFLDQEQIDAVNISLRLDAAIAEMMARFNSTSASATMAAEAIRNVGDAETEVAVKAVPAIAAITALNARIATSGTALRNGLTGFNLWQGAFAALNQQIPLWGGLLDGLLPKMLTQVGAWHVWGDAIIEVVAVWSGAAIALGAWGAAASDAITTVQRHFTDLHTVADAMNQAIPPMTDNMENLHKAVQPQVFQLLGDALTVVKAKGGALNTVIMQTGQVLDQLGARAALAIQGSKLTEFTTNAVTDVRLLGTAFGNLFGIIGNLIRMNQGWATVLLQVGTAFLGLLEHVTALIIPLGQLLVLGHGFVLWVGLAVTAALKLGSILIGWGAAIAGAVTDFIGLIGAIRDYIAVFGVLEALSLVDPLAWVALAAGAIAALVVVLGSSKSAVQQWGDTVVAAAQKASTVTGALAVLQTGVAESAVKVASAQKQLNTAMSQSGAVVTGSMSRFQGYSGAVRGAQAAVSDATQVHTQLSSELTLVNGRVGSLAKTYGGTSNAIGLLNQAGITNTQIMDKSAGTWALIQQQVAATAAGFAAMGTQAGVAGNNMQVLDSQATDMYQAIQKVNSGWSTFTANMTGTQSSFDTFAQGLNTMASNASTFTNRLGEITLTGRTAKVAIDSLTPAGIALNSAFTQQVGNLNSMIASWRTANVSQDQFKAGIGASIAPLEQYAKGSQEATAQLVGMAEQAGDQGPVSLQALNKFLGITSGQLHNTAGDLATMKAVANQATIQTALLTTAMQAQGNYIASQLIGDINQAILKYDGVAAAATAYGNAVAQSGRDSDAAHQARQTLVNDLVASGKAAGDSTGQIAAMIAKVLGIPAKVAMQLIMTGTGSFSIQGAVTSGKAVAGITTGIPAGIAAASGAYINVGSGPRSDDVLAAVSRGEVIVPTHMVNAGAVDHLRGKIPGFAGGGLVLAGNTSVLTGDYAVSSHNRFISAGASSMEAAMLAAARANGAKFADGGQVTGSTAATATGAGAPTAALLLQPAIVQGFSGSLEQLHAPLVMLAAAISDQTNAIKAQTTATTAASTATKAATAATTAAKTAAAQPKLTPAQAAVAAETKKITADKANAATLAARIAAVEQAVKDTPAKDKAARGEEHALLRTLQEALAKQKLTTGSDEAALRKDIIAANKQIVSAMQKQIAAITKLLGSGTAATAPNALWTQLAADEKSLAAASAAIKAQTSGASGGASSSAAKTAAATTTSAAHLASIKSQLAAAYKTLDQLYAADKAAAKGSAARSKLYSEIQAQWNKIDALLAADKKAKAAAGSSSTASGGTGSSYSTSYVIDRKAETDLAAILAEVKTENGLLRQVLTALTVIKAEAEPAAQAKAIGPAVAQAINSTARTAASAKTTRRG